MADFTAQQLRLEIQLQMADGAVLDKVSRYGKTYIAASYDCNVAPTADVLKASAAIHEPMPDGMGNAEKILDQLHEVGGPGTMCQNGAANALIRARLQNEADRI